MFEESASAVPSIWASLFSWFTPTVLFVFLNLMIGTIFITSSFASNTPTTEDQRKQQQQQQEHQPHLARSPSVLQRLKSINFYTYRSHEPISGYEKSPDVDAHFSFYQQQTPDQEQKQQPFLSRSPSVLQRLKSINLYGYISQEPTSPFTSTPSTVQHTHENINHYPPEQAKVQEQLRVPEEEEKVDGIQRVEEEAEEAGKEEQHEQIQDQEESLDEIYSRLKGTHVTRTKSDTKPASGEIPPKLPRKMRKSASTKSAFAHFEEEDIAETRRPATVREGKAKVEVDDEEVDAKADDFINRFKQQLKLQRIDSIIRYKDIINRGSAR